MCQPESIACRGLHGRPANGAGCIFGVVGAARAEVFGVDAGQNAGASVRHTRAEPSPAPTVELQNGDKNFTHSLAVYCRGGALLHPRGLAAAQGFSGRAILAPTMKLQKSNIILRKPESLACRGLHCRPANGAGVYFGGCRCGEGGGVRCGCGAKRRGQRSAHPGGAKPRPYGGITKWR